MRDAIEEIRGAGAELVIVGSGAAHFAAAFIDELELDSPVLVDPDLVSYRAAGLRRGRVEALSPRLPLKAARALLAGHRQGAVQGDPWQLGGVLVIRPGGAIAFRHVNSDAADHVPIDGILAALSDTG